MSQPVSNFDGQKPQLVVDIKNQLNDAITIVIVHKDKPEFLNICLQSITVMSSNNNYEVVVVDNGSGPESQKFLDEIENHIKVVRNPKNLYWSVAANQGLKAADINTKYVIFMHCDVVILNPSWMDLLINVCESNNSGMVGIESGTCRLFNQNVPYVQEWLVLFSRDALERAGGWPEELPMIGHSFIMTLKTQVRGFKPQVMANNIAHHYKIFSIDINEYERIEEESKKLLPMVYQKAQSRSVI